MRRHGVVEERVWGMGCMIRRLAKGVVRGRVW